MRQQQWWKEATAYEIWPASYKDSNGDGIGDIQGIIETLDYLVDLGVDVLWICPIYESPGEDMGYDVSDFEGVDPRYGTLEDVDELVAKCHSKNIKVLFDLVINHTSKEHKWFLESRSSRSSPKRDWYIWRPAKVNENGQREPPNNWRSRFGGSAWSWDEETEEYYLHLYTVSQPDLNWRCNEARQAIYDSAIRFWLERGIDGFRVDVANMFSKPDHFVDAPIRDATSQYQLADDVWCNGPHIHEYHHEIYEVLEPYGAITVGELPNTPNLQDIEKYVSASAKELNMVFLMDIVWLGLDKECRYNTHPISAQAVKRELARSQSLVNSSDCWTTVFLENHDQARSISRFAAADTEHRRQASGKLLAMMLAACSGTLFLYQGQELGMVNMPRDWGVEEYQDVQSQIYISQIQKASREGVDSMAKAMSGLNAAARDNSRTPFQWNNQRNAGFSSGQPWMRINDNYRDLNAEAQSSDPSSVLSFWRKMLELRKAWKDVFVYGDFHVLNPDLQQQITFTKSSGSSTVLVDLNFGDEERQLFVPEKWAPGEMLLTNMTSYDRQVLKPWEGRIYTLEPLKNVQ